MTRFGPVVAALALMPAASGWAQDRSQPTLPSSAAAERCIGPAAGHHRVNPLLLRAILKVESNLRPAAISRNGNGTFDVGIGQINSRHFPLLAGHGIQPAHLLDPCIGTYVAAWHLSGVIASHGNTWEAVARYHSATPYFNRRYRILLNNELVAAGVIAGVRLPVPALQAGSVAPARPASRARASADTPAVVLDQHDGWSRSAAPATSSIAAGVPWIDVAEHETR